MKRGYIHVEPVLGNYIHGDNKLGTVPIQPGGQWDEFLPETHQQDENGFEPNDCVTEATITCTEILEKQEYGTNTQWARRFLAKNSGTDLRGGNDPQTVSESLRKNGCCSATDYTFKASSLADFYKDLTGHLKTLALGEFAKFSYGHSWVNANQKDMMAALAYSPLSAAGYAWEKDPKTGYYISPKGSVPEHDFVVYGYVENKYWKIRDSYSPFNKKLAWDFDFTGVKRHTLKKQTANTSKAEMAWENFLNFLRSVVGIDPTFGSARSPLWPHFKRQFEQKNPKICAVCGGTKKVQLHHIKPYHLHKELELSEDNVIWLCTGNKTINCHLRMGHWDNFRTKYNPHIREEASKWYARFSATIEDESL